jgi:SAM-dependent methyltransferase
MTKLTTFHDYAESYDFFYEHKDYAGEARFVAETILSHHPKAKSLLDLGCGTGQHALHFLALNFDVVGADQSADMLALAKKRLPTLGEHLHLGDVTEIKLGNTFDCIVSLFHVMSYMTTDQKIHAFFQNLSEHLAPGGVAVVDFWYGPGVLSQKPEVRKKSITTQNQKVTKISVPQHDPLSKTISVQIDLEVQELSTDDSRLFKEVHNMRYFFDHELVELSLASGLEMAELHEWMKKTGHPDHESWSAYAVLIKK